MGACCAVSLFVACLFQAGVAMSDAGGEASVVGARDI